MPTSPATLLGVKPAGLTLRAWGYFVGSSGAFTFVKGSNCSVVRASVGTYTVTFTVPLPDANYIVRSLGDGSGGSYTQSKLQSRTVNGCTLKPSDQGGSNGDPDGGFHFEIWG